MILSELIRQFRVLAFDKEQPYLFSDEDITDWLNDAVKEAAIRGRLIHESSNPDVCVINMLPDVDTYPLHESLYEIEHARHTYEVLPARWTNWDVVYQVSQEEVFDGLPYLNKNNGAPAYLVQHDTHIQVHPMPERAGVIKLSGYRIPLAPMVLDTDRPEINIIHHEYLIQWALHKGFGIPDSEVFDMNRSALAEQEFTNYFGQRPDSDLRRITREDVPHVVKPFWV